MNLVWQQEKKLLSLNLNLFLSLFYITDVATNIITLHHFFVISLNFEKVNNFYNYSESCE